jgi:hypothetical protein
MRQKGFSSFAAIILIVIFVVIAAGAVYYVQQKKVDDLNRQVDLLAEKQTKDTIESTVKNEVAPANETVTADDYTPTATETTTDEKSTDNPTKTTSGSNVPFYLGAYHTFGEGKKLLSQTVIDQLDNNQEIIKGDIMPISTKDQKTFYFSTIKTEADRAATAKIYSYNSDSEKLREIYWERYGKILFPLGVEDNKLVVYLQKTTDEPSSCFVPWLDATIQYLDLTNPADGLNDYTANDETLTKARTLKGNCQ